jgi:hypothetical protein
MKQKRGLMEATPGEILQLKRARTIPIRHTILPLTVSEMSPQIQPNVIWHFNLLELAPNGKRSYCEKIVNLERDLDPLNSEINIETGLSNPISLRFPYLTL